RVNPSPTTPSVQNSNPRPSGIVCFKCQGKGNVARDCPNQIAMVLREGEVVMDDEEDPTEVAMDTGSEEGEEAVLEGLEQFAAMYIHTLIPEQEASTVILTEVDSVTAPATPIDMATTTTVTATDTLSDKATVPNPRVEVEEAGVGKPAGDGETQVVSTRADTCPNTSLCTSPDTSPSTSADSNTDTSPNNSSDIKADPSPVIIPDTCPDPSPGSAPDPRPGAGSLPDHTRLFSAFLDIF
ncbi:hypothetical protein LINPERPRIM_LOCUS2025, partial [Linum perenne]